ncbi:unnamed protein product [marine sediment metagenome]|uniref:Uncharacterized protein n=1 Tax=marine sediment metagenome TaxID=412755 RepID=X0YG79_9ZZZZ
MTDKTFNAIKKINKERILDTERGGNAIRIGDISIMSDTLSPVEVSQLAINVLKDKAVKKYLSGSFKRKLMLGVG